MTLKKLIIIVVAVTLLGPIIHAKPSTVNWEQLAQLDNETGVIPKEIEQLIQEEIQIAGFIVPLELGEDTEKVSEFVLVPNPLACLHVPPPPPNQMIYVKMSKEIPLDMDLRGVYITGQLSIPKPKAEYGLYSYELTGRKAKPANIEVKDEIFELITQ